MKLAFSTLGCPDATLSEAAALAASQGYAGLELRSASNGTVSPDASAEQRRLWRTELERLDVRALAISSYVRLCDMNVADDEVVESGLAQARLGQDLGASWLRIFPGGKRGVPVGADVEERARGRLADLVSATREVDIELAVETHDSHQRAQDVLRLLDGNGCDQVSVIWDALHTWLGGEAPTETATRLAGRLAYLQVKDVASGEDLTPLSLGEGVLPLLECLELSQKMARTDWVSWEYERLWHPEIPSLDELAPQARDWLVRT